MAGDEKMLRRSMKTLQHKGAAEFLRKEEEEVLSLPPAMVSLLTDWYHQNRRILPWREDPQPYFVWVSEIMLQQTRVEAVIPYFYRFMEALPTVEDLAAANEETLLKLWEGLGYYRRVRNLQKAAQKIMKEYDGMLPDTVEQLKQLPGIGDYTAGAIASIAFSRPVPAVDGNVMRVASRVAEFYQEIDSPAAKRQVTRALADIYPIRKSGDFTQSLMDLGAMVCVPNGAPKCLECPLQQLCLAHLRGSVDELPMRAPKRKRRQENRTVFLMTCDERTAVCKRPSAGLLADLWELPNTDGHLVFKEAQVHLKQWKLGTMQLTAGANARHIFTHVQWDMKVYHVACTRMDTAFVWAAPEELEQTYALPTAFKQILDRRNK